MQPHLHLSVCPVRVFEIALPAHVRLLTVHMDRVIIAYRIRVMTQTRPFPESRLILPTVVLYIVHCYCHLLPPYLPAAAIFLAVTSIDQGSAGSLHRCTDTSPNLANAEKHFRLLAASTSITAMPKEGPDTHSNRS